MGATHSSRWRARLGGVLSGGFFQETSIRETTTERHKRGESTGDSFGKRSFQAAQGQVDLIILFFLPALCHFDKRSC
jgi:hypothetical protein